MRLLKAIRKEPVDCTPVWFMRQAGRYMAEYRALREKHTLLEICKTPELALEVTLQPLDARHGRGDPLRRHPAAARADGRARSSSRRARARSSTSRCATAADVDRLRVDRARGGPRLRARGDPAHPPRARRQDAAHRLRRRAVHARELPRSRAATRATSRTTKQLMYARARGVARRSWTSSPRSCAATCARRSTPAPQAVQLFDSWVGALSPEDYREYVLPHVAPHLRRTSRRAACRSSTSARRRRTCWS